MLKHGIVGYFDSDHDEDDYHRCVVWEVAALDNVLSFSFQKEIQKFAPDFSLDTNSIGLGNDGDYLLYHFGQKGKVHKISVDDEVFVFYFNEKKLVRTPISEVYEHFVRLI